MAVITEPAEQAAFSGSPETASLANVRSGDTPNRNEESYRLLIERLQEYAIFMLAPDSRIVTWNMGAQRFFGYTEAEAIGQLGAMIFTEEDRAVGAPEQEIDTALRTGKAEDNRWHVRRDGSRFWATGVLTALYEIDGALRGFVKILRDNTDRKLAEAALQESEANFRQVWEITSDALALSDAEGIVLNVNPAYLQLYGYPREQVIGQRFVLIFPEEQRAAAMAHYQVVFALAEPPEPVEAIVRRRDGTERSVEVRTTFFFRDGKRTGLLSTMRDITERKAAEVALRQAYDALEMRIQERTQALVATNTALQAEIVERQRVEVQLRTVGGQLALAEQEERRRIAQLLHDDLQQQLYGIKMRMMLITMEATADSTVVAYAQEAYTWLDDAIRMTRHLTVNLSPPILEEEGLTNALTWLATQMAADYGLRVAVRSEHAFRLSSKAMRVLIFQLVRELLFNVVKHGATNEATVELAEGEAHTLRLTVSDQGRGFEVKRAEVKQPGSFGLFSVRERLMLFGGHMDIVSMPGQGTRITLTVPMIVE